MGCQRTALVLSKQSCSPRFSDTIYPSSLAYVAHLGPGPGSAGRPQQHLGVFLEAGLRAGLVWGREKEEAPSGLRSSCC